MNEAQLNAALLRRGLGFVAADPWRYARLSLSRVKEYVKFWPTRDSTPLSNAARVLSSGLLLPMTVAGLVLAFARSGMHVGQGATRADVLLLLGMAGAYTLVHLLSWTLVRYRIPVDALLVPVAALAVVCSWDYVNVRMSAPLT